MKESLEAKVVWKDVSKETFQAFAQFAYTGDYSVPPLMLQEELTSVVASDEARMDSEAPADVGWSFGYGQKPHEAQAASMVSFRSRNYAVAEPRSRFAASCNATVLLGRPDNVLEVLLLHAALYVLAEKYGVDSLQSLSLLKLHKSLTLFELSKRRAPDMVKLLRYVYSDENTLDQHPLIDNLRRMMCEYVSDKAQIFRDDASYLELMYDGGAFARDIFRHLVVSPSRVGLEQT